MVISVQIDRQDSVGIKIFDYLNAFHADKSTDFYIRFDKDYQNNADVNILFVTKTAPTKTYDLNQFDLVVMSNNDEPLTVANRFMQDNIDRENTYMVSNSFVTQDHKLCDKIIFANNDSLLCRQYWTNAIFPQYYEARRHQSRSRDQKFIFINGENRSWRHHYVSLITHHVPEITVRSKLSNLIHETNDAPWETKEDTAFREFVNSHYDIKRNQSTNYYDLARPLSFISRIDGLPESASIPPGFDLLPEYFDYKCVIFPESNWLNNELSMTEKVYKCFFSGALPWPIGGAYCNDLYDKLGFITAWHFLPRDMQEFDSITDHRARARQTIKAMSWLVNHFEVFDSAEMSRAIAHNRARFFSNDIDTFCVRKLTDLILQCKGRKKINGHT